MEEGILNQFDYVDVMFLLSIIALVIIVAIVVQWLELI